MFARLDLPFIEPRPQPVLPQPLRDGAHDRFVLRTVAEEDVVGERWRAHEDGGDITGTPRQRASREGATKPQTEQVIGRFLSLAPGFSPVTQRITPPKPFQRLWTRASNR